MLGVERGDIVAIYTTVQANVSDKHYCMKWCILKTWKQV